MDKTPKRPIQR